MSTKEAYKQKMEADLEAVEAKMAGFQAHLKSATADARIQYDKQIEELEKGIQATRTKVKDLGEAGEDAWERLQEGVESAWSSLSKAVQDATAMFKK